MIRVASYGGGVNSTAMILNLLDKDERLDYIVFADTGAEYPETYSFVLCFEKWLKENHGLHIHRVQSMDGPMYEFMLAKKRVPSYNFPAKHIEKWKIRPIMKFYQSIRLGQEIEECLGIGFDERDRQRTTRAKWIKKRYPLIDAQIDRYDCKEIIKKHGLPVPIKSGCYFCPYQTRSRWLWNKREHPELFTKSRRLEEQFPMYPNVGLFYGGRLAKLGAVPKGQETLEISCLAMESCGV